MFAKKVLISLALVAAIPLAFSKHLPWILREDNIEDLDFSPKDVIPDDENAVEYGEDDTQGQNIDLQNRDNFKRELHNQRVPNSDISPKKVYGTDVDPEIPEDDNSENNANDDNNYPDIHEIVVPEENWNAREPVLIMVNPYEEESQDFPEYNENTENKNEEVETWDHDQIPNDIPQPAKTFWGAW